jgi:acetolactate synthase-1/2/3 large subunit
MAIGQIKAEREIKAEYSSDVIVDLLRALDIEYVALNPGSSYRGLHDSLVNYGGNKNPETILCTHEEIAVAIADGYGKATGKLMAAFVHDIVGLLHSSMAIFNAWMGHSGVLVLGATGPMAVERRRPGVEWMHSALVQGTAVRDYVKWDDEPASLTSAVESLIRAHQIADAEPKGPVYVCFDAALQEEALQDGNGTIPDLSRYNSPTRIQADPVALERAAELLVGAHRPVILANSLNGVPEAIDGLVQLAEGLALPVVDQGSGFPSQHSLNAADISNQLLNEADVILTLNLTDLHEALTTTDRITRLATDRIPLSAKVIDISLRQFTIRSWANNVGRPRPVDLSIVADTSLALPSLAKLCQEKLGQQPNRIEELRQRGARLAARHKEATQAALNTADQAGNQTPIAIPFLSQQVWEAVKSHDWVLANGLGAWTRWIWDIKYPYQQVPGGSGGGVGNGYPRSLGVALAYRGTGRVCVNFQGDGDLLFTPSSLWTAAHHQIPLLTIVRNNRSYYNDEEHQANMARVRGRSVENRVIGIRIEDPDVDLASMARSFGVYAEGPIKQPEELAPALERAVRMVAEEGKPALVDVWVERASNR